MVHRPTASLQASVEQPSEAIITMADMRNQNVIQPAKATQVTTRLPSGSGDATSLIRRSGTDFHGIIGVRIIPGGEDCSGDDQVMRLGTTRARVAKSSGQLPSPCRGDAPFARATPVVRGVVSQRRFGDDTGRVTEVTGFGTGVELSVHLK